MSYEEIPHTADVKIRVRADTLNDLFSDAFDALMQVMYGTDRKGGSQKVIDLSSGDMDSLMRDFLSEVLFVSEVDGIVFSGTEIHINGLDLNARMDGEPFDRIRHSSGTEVKGISYSGLAITHDANGYMLDILFDV
jgi:SHS2 domain-containing protein